MSKSMSMSRNLVLVVVAAVIVAGAGVVLAVRHLLPRPPALLLVYRVDAEVALRERRLNLGHDLQRLVGAAIRITEDRDGLVLRATAPAALQTAREQVDKQHRQTLVWQPLDAQTARLTLTEAAKRQTRELTIGRAATVVRQRISWADTALYVDGERLRLELPAIGPDEVGALKRNLTRRALLEFRLVDDPSAVLMQLAERVPADGSIRVLRDSYDGKARGEVRTVTLAAPSFESLQRFVEKHGAPLLKLGDELLYGENTDDEGRPQFVAYHVLRQPSVGGEQIENADVQFNEQTGRPDVALTFGAAGARAFAELSGNHIGWRLAIVLDGRVNSAPILQSRIEGGRAHISLGGLRSRLALMQEARDLVAVLRAGALPVPLVLEEARHLGR